ncbi:6-phosphofructokinase [Criibacterium bergeronii]|uniref:ATP-dependent 6-phosphofructokinase n=1 Tax=Criibacterium bergeronii TaxID=1871336 RepID=A0A371IJ54_9FIRM|nr:6-phosphofructokinase [Criibacterium bergeronii]MBS6063837.1 6-phosphofructokinase [Peptostreptococcaceae bacterium]RDY20507.1 6-phosphofructokinase [Criibacterium bergeronii]TRW24035.1 6-phosphofructokinase [Criibacterium bergeronii]
MKRIAVLTSGGDAPGMNAAIRAVVRYSIYNGLQVFGVKRGYKGLIEGDLKEMTIPSVGDIIHRGGTILRSARCLEFQEEIGREKALNILNIFKIDGLVAIGGDGTFRGAMALSEMGFPVIGVPGTIDNDLSYTDYTIGFDTSVNTVLDAVTKLRDTTSSHERVSVVQVMGRNCGDIALYAGLGGGAEAVIVPEVEFDMDKLSENVSSSMNRGKNQSIILVAEGVGSAEEICKKLQEKTGLEARTTILGHIQRGGNPTSNDRVLASKLGQKAVQCLIEGKSSRVVGIRSNEIIDMDIHEALKMERKFDMNMYNLINILAR